MSAWDSAESLLLKEEKTNLAFTLHLAEMLEALVGLLGNRIFSSSPTLQ